MEYLFTELDTNLFVLADAISWWRNVCAPVLKLAPHWLESSRSYSLNGTELDFSNPVYAMHSADGKRVTQIIQQPAPKAGEPPAFYVLIKSVFKGYDDVNNGNGITVMDMGCPASQLTASKVETLATAWMVDGASPDSLLSLARRVQPPCIGYLGIDL